MPLEGKAKGAELRVLQTEPSGLSRRLCVLFSVRVFWKYGTKWVRAWLEWNKDSF